MRKASDPRGIIHAHLADETGTLTYDAPERVAWLYPSPYRVGMSSLGYQSLYRAICETPGRTAHRAFLPDNPEHHRRTRTPLITYEGQASISEYPIIAVSVAYEMEIAGLIEALQLAGIPPLAKDRDAQQPFVLAGGPLTFSNPLPLGPYVDVVLMGEADQTVHKALDIFFACQPSRPARKQNKTSKAHKTEALRAIADAVPSAYIPEIHGDEMPPVAKSNDADLPAYSQIITPHTELRSMFLIEPERGCHRGCTYCVMRRSTNGGMRKVAKERVLSLIPEEAKRVGLVGAATTDHPQITDIVEAIAASGREVGLSSLRADRLTDRFVAALRAGGQTVLTTASDGASARLRNMIQRRAPDQKILEAAELVHRHKMKRLKLYMMLGLPTETDEDIDELIQFSLELANIAPLSLGIAPFVAKRNTPLDGEDFAGIQVVEQRLARLRQGLKGRVDVRATSARWAWVEYVLAQGGQSEGRTVLEAVRLGGKFRHWKQAFDTLPKDRKRRALVRPGNRLQRSQLQKKSQRQKKSQLKSLKSLPVL